MRERCQVRRRVPLMESLQHFADAAVQSCPFGGTQLLVDGFPDQCMGEPVPPRRARVADEDLAAQGRPEDVEQRVRSEPTRPASRSANSPFSRSTSDVRSSVVCTSLGWRSSISAIRYSQMALSVPENSATKRSGSA